MEKKKTVNTQFREAGLNREQISYARVLLRMGRTVAQAIEEAKAAKSEYGMKAVCTGLTKDQATIEAKRLRAQGVYATIWYIEGPKTGPRSRYEVRV